MRINIFIFPLASSLTSLTTAIGCTSNPGCQAFKPDSPSQPLNQLFAYLQNTPTDAVFPNDKPIACIPGVIAPQRCASLCVSVQDGAYVDKGELMSAAAYLLYGHGCDRCGEARLWSPCKHRLIENGVLSVKVREDLNGRWPCQRACQGLCKLDGASEGQRLETQVEM